MYKYFTKLFERYIKNSQYKKNVLSMIIGRVIAQSIPILLTPVLTRIYSPEDFGVFGVFATIVAIVGMVSSGRYCLSIILPKSIEKSKRLFFLSSTLTILTVFLFAVFLLIWGKGFFSILNVSILYDYRVVVILAVLFIGLYEDAYYFALRVKAFKILTSNIIIQALLLVISRLVFGYLGFTDSGLIISYLLGYSISFTFMILRVEISIPLLVKEFKIRNYIELMKEYYRFPKYSLLADTLSMTSNMSPSILLNKVFGVAQAGFYSMSDKILGSPLWLVTSAVGDVFRQEASEQLREKGSCYDIFRKTVKAMFLLGIGPFLLIFIFAPYIIPFLLGPGWEEVGVFIQIFAIMYFVRFIVRPVYTVLYIVKKQNYNAIFQGINLFFIITAFVIGAITGDLYLTLVLWSIFSSLSYLIILGFSYKFARDVHYEPEE